MKCSESNMFWLYTLSPLYFNKAYIKLTYKERYALYVHIYTILNMRAFFRPETKYSLPVLTAWNLDPEIRSFTWVKGYFSGRLTQFWFIHTSKTLIIIKPTDQLLEDFNFQGLI